MKLVVGRVYLSLGDSPWDFVLFCFWLSLGHFFNCWVLGIFCCRLFALHGDVYIEYLHEMVFIIDSFAKKNERKIGGFLPRWLCDRSLPSKNEIVFGETASLRVVL